MSKQNKVNPSQYTIAGRLTPDELATERTKQRNVETPPAPDAGAAQPAESAKTRTPRARAASKSRG